MKTILFIDRSDTSPNSAWSSYLSYDFLLEDHYERGAYFICDWNPEGRSVVEAIPNLTSLIEEDEDWQAIIVTDLRLEASDPVSDIHFDNPFDFVENYENVVGSPVQESERPIIRLTQMLGGLPEKTSIAWPDYIATLSSEENPLTKEDLVAPQRPGFTERFEVNYPADEANFYDMLRRYRLGIQRPARIVCMTPRDVDASLFERRAIDLENNLKQKEEDERLALEESHLKDRFYEEDLAKEAAESSATDVYKKHQTNRLAAQIKLEQFSATTIDFWQRNNYPASTRFLVCDQIQKADNPDEDEDIKKEEEPLFKEMRRDEWFRFWLCFLSFVTSGMSFSALRPYTVHSIDVDIDEQELERLFQLRYSQWSAVESLVKTEETYDKLQLEIPDFDSNMPGPPAPVLVAFSDISVAGMTISNRLVRFFKDQPEKDERVWKSARDTSYQQFKRLIGAPKRALNRAAKDFRYSSHLSDDEIEYCVLGEVQRDELEDELDAIEFSLAEGTGISALNHKSYHSLFYREAKKVEKAIPLRATLQHALIATIVAILVVFIGFLPFILGLGSKQTPNAGMWEAFGIFSIVLITSAALVIAHMMWSLRRKYDAFNGALLSVEASLHSEAKLISQRLTTYANFRRKWKVFNRQRTLHEPTKRALQLGEYGARLRTRLDDVEKIIPNVTVDPIVFDTISQAGWKNALSLLGDEGFLRLSQEDLVPRKAILSLPSTTEAGEGYVVDVLMPYAFIQSLSVLPLKVR